MSKQNQKAKAAPTQVTGVFKTDSIRVCLLALNASLSFTILCLIIDFFGVSQDVAESLNITSLSDSVASALASDVEYRIHQVVEVRTTTCYSVECYLYLPGSSTIYATCAENNHDDLGHRPSSARIKH